MLTAYRSAVGAALATLTLLASAVAAGSLAHAAEGDIIGAGTASAIPGRYIVVLKDGEKHSAKASVNVKESAKALSDQYRGKLGDVYERTLSGFAVEMDEAQAKRLAADPRVAYVEQEHLVHLNDTQEYPPSWGLDRVDQRAAPPDTTYSYDVYPSTAVTVYVVDSGIRISHNDFGGRATNGWDFIGGDAIAEDCYGHGTHMAGVIGGASYGVAKNARLKAVRIFDCAGVASTAKVQSAVEWITVNAVKPAVVNLSLNYKCQNGGVTVPCSASEAMSIRTAISNSIASGISYVLSAGNDGMDACGSPFNLVTTAISVGSSNILDNKSSTSNFGSCVDIWAPGDTITSTYFTSDSATAAKSGTSPAAAHVSGALAQMLTRPNYATKTPAQLFSQLLTESTSGALSGLGTGSPNKLLYTSPPPVAGGSPVALAKNTDGRLTLFGVNLGGTLFLRTQTLPDATTWTPWTVSVDPNWYSVCADIDLQTRIKLVGLRRNYEPWHRTQVTVNQNAYSTWTKFDGLLNSCATTTEGGRLYVFGTNAQGQLWSRSETVPGNGVFTSWTLMPGVPALRSIAAERNGSGTVQLFGLGRDGAIFTCSTIGANCLPTGWSQVDGLLKTIAVARGYLGTPSIFGVNPAGQLFRRDWFAGAWFDWEQMDVPANVGTLRSVAAEANADGRIELVAVNLAGQVWRRSQSTPGGLTYGPWSQLDGLLRP